MGCYTQLLYSFRTNADCTTECIDRNFDSEQFSTNSASSYSFISCSWEGCLREPGGAISSTRAGASIAVISCTFHRCNSTSGTVPNEEFNGGAICVVRPNSLVVSSCSFVKCSAPQTDNDNGGSGGIYTHSIQRGISLSSSDFISCFTGSSGAALFFESVSPTHLNEEIISDCKFIHCRSQDQSPDGGAMALWEHVNVVWCYNCLFSECSTTGSGGGMDILFGQDFDSYPIKFCFFAHNKGESGNDLALSASYMLEGELIQHCLSTSAPTRVVYWTTTWCIPDYTWLPQANSNPT